MIMRRMRKPARLVLVLTASAAFAPAACGSSSRPAEQPLTHNPPGVESATPAVALKPGDPAPALVATASNGTKIDLAAMKGKIVVVYFYPKDDTPGCTAEACAFRDAWSKLEAANVFVIGVSEDDDASHRAFSEKFKLTFPLVADTDGSIARRFGVPLDQGYAARQSFLIDVDGTIKKVYPKVSPAAHADEIIADAGTKGA